MIYHYSTIIQFLAAIYVTLSFDNTLFKSLWSLDYVSLINERISNLPGSVTTKIGESLKSSITVNAKNIEKLSRIRGCYCLVFAVVTLLYSGYEQGLDINVSTDQSVRLLFFFYVVISIIGFILSSIFIKRFLFLFGLCLFLVLIPLSLNLCDFSFLLEYDYLIQCVDNTQYFVLCIMIMPLIFQLFITWLFTDNYYYILSNKIKAEYDLYQQALNADKSDNVPEEYSRAITQSYYDNLKNKKDDTKVTNLINEFQNRLKEAITIPSICKLIKYALCSITQKKIDGLELIPNLQIKGEEITKHQKTEGSSVGSESSKQASKTIKNKNGQRYKTHK